MKAYVIVESWGTCPSDSFEAPILVYAEREAADADLKTRPEQKHGGPFYSIVECEFVPVGES